MGFRILLWNICRKCWFFELGSKEIKETNEIWLNAYVYINKSISNYLNPFWQKFFFTDVSNFKLSSGSKEIVPPLPVRFLSISIKQRTCVHQNSERDRITDFKLRRRHVSTFVQKWSQNIYRSESGFFGLVPFANVNGVYDLYCRQPPGGEPDAVGAVMSSIFVYRQWVEVFFPLNLTLC